MDLMLRHLPLPLKSYLGADIEVPRCVFPRQQVCVAAEEH